MLVAQPDNGEQALEIVETLVRSAVDLIVVDSVVALVPQAEIEEIWVILIWVCRRLMSQALRKLTGIISRSNLQYSNFINQLRMKIELFGNPRNYNRW